MERGGAEMKLDVAGGKSLSLSLILNQIKEAQHISLGEVCKTHETSL